MRTDRPRPALWLHALFKHPEPTVAGDSQRDDFFTQKSQSIPDFAEDPCRGGFSLLKQKRNDNDGVGVSLVTKHWEVTPGEGKA